MSNLSSSGFLKGVLGNLTSEQEQASVRVAFSLFATTYFFYFHYSGWMGGITVDAIYASVFYVVAAISLLISAFYFDKGKKTHRIISILLDTIIITYCLILGGLVTAAFFGGYLWIAIANGLRFGRYYLYFTTILSIVCFSIVIIFSEFWQQYYVMGLGLMLWLILLPFYTSLLLIKLEDAVKKAEDANHAKSQFLSSMSHELRTPLNAILGFSQLIELHTKDDMTKSNSKEIIDGGNYLLELINEVLDLSKIESGTVDLSIKSHSFNKIFNDTMSLIKPIADKHSIQICNKVNPSSDININVDETRFKQVLLNILSNAIKYNSENAKVTIDYSLDDKKMLHILITDLGKGLTAEQQIKIFLPFDRAGAENSNIEGTGLGLSISKSLIEQMGGKITVESEVGSGSCFIVQAPLS